MKQLLFAGIAFLLLAISCNQASEKESLQTATIADVKLEAPVSDTAALAFEQSPAIPGEEKQEEPKKQSPKTSQSPESKPDWNKKIIKTAALNVEVKDYAKFNQLVHSSASRFGGYIADELQSETEYKIENTIVMKVPVDQFQSAVDFLTSGDGKINEKKISSEDVTTQFVDTKSRLEAKKQVRLRYLDLLKQAKNMEEILQVQSEINDIQEEIESAAGRINYLSNASAMSTINLTYYQVINASAKDTDTVSFWEKTKYAFLSGWHGLVEVLIGLLNIWPLALIAAIVVWTIKRSVFKKVKSPQA
ncbi:DUF4349 domain-containing protein [Lacibacter sediminis]|uniref:DUF4349 domain-containing protein n=1 Tax=Lacibacter sediminis TaxID=2760713 RepID=A0A7G5XKW8_9BACT|nr:DUF4349 domain-containing protein [Lacibacter sediminis]QNA46121.1 DUF4349 domain-containing protein [Lacibacter sediminis]